MSSSSQSVVSDKSIFSTALDQLNFVALAGWIYVLYRLSTQLDVDDTVLKTVNALEAICLLEVARIGLGQLPGNLLFGTVLHSVRVIALTVVFPRSDGVVNKLIVLFSWAATEVSRYPMYVFSSSRVARLGRMVVPMVTFPIGCGSEAYGAWRLLSDDVGGVSHGVLASIALVYLLFVNLFMGPFMAYPFVIQKGRREMWLYRRPGKKTN